MGRRVISVRRGIVSIGLFNSRQLVVSPQTSLSTKNKHKHTFTCSSSWSDPCAAPGLKSSSSSSSSAKSSFKKLRDMLASYRRPITQTTCISLFFSRSGNISDKNIPRHRVPTSWIHFTAPRLIGLRTRREQE